MRDLLRTFRLAVFSALPVFLVSILPSTAHAFFVDASVSAEALGMVDDFDSCSFADDPAHLSCSVGPVFNRVPGDASASARASLTDRKIRFRAAAGESISPAGTGAARADVSLGDMYRLAAPASQSMMIGVKYTVTGSVTTGRDGQSLVTLDTPLGTTVLDRQNFADPDIIFSGKYSETQWFAVGAGQTGNFFVNMRLVGQEFFDSIADFSTTGSVSFVGPPDLELISESGQTAFTVPLPGVLWLFFPGLAAGFAWLRTAHRQA